MSALAFRPVAATARRAKVLLLGEAGSGKTHAALTFPKPAVIDAEGSIDWFADRFDFVAVPTKSYADVRDLIKSVRAGRVPCETLVIDSLTSIYNGLLNAASSEREDLRPLDWGRIKRKFSSLLDELYHQLPMNVVCIGWIKPEYAKPGDNINGQVVKANDLVKIGETFDGDKKTLYAFDFVFKLEVVKGKYFATVVKSRSGALKAGQKIADFSWKTLAPLLPSGGDDYHGMTDEEQIVRDGGVLETQDDSAGDRGSSVTPPPQNATTGTEDGKDEALRTKIADQCRRGFAALSFTAEKDYYEAILAATGRKVPGFSWPTLETDELVSLSKHLVALFVAQQATKFCSLCEAPTGQEHEYDEYGNPCENDQSEAAMKVRADAVTLDSPRGPAATLEDEVPDLSLPL